MDWMALVPLSLRVPIGSARPLGVGCTEEDGVVADVEDEAEEDVDGAEVVLADEEVELDIEIELDVSCVVEVLVLELEGGGDGVEVVSGVEEGVLRGSEEVSESE